jgi:spore coat protein U-like protein
MCSIVSASMTFASYDPIATNRTTDKTVLGTIQINCEGATQVTISLAVGTGSR